MKINHDTHEHRDGARPVFRIVPRDAEMGAATGLSLERTGSVGNERSESHRFAQQGRGKDRISSKR